MRFSGLLVERLPVRRDPVLCGTEADLPVADHRVKLVLELVLAGAGHHWPQGRNSPLGVGGEWMVHLAPGGIVTTADAGIELFGRAADSIVHGVNVLCRGGTASRRA